jgi:uncharacterized protein YhaN
VNLSPEQEKIRQHWQKFRPKMYQGLEKSGKLEAALKNADALTKEAYGQAIEQGLNPDQARELTREQWAYLPDEKQMPELGVTNQALSEDSDQEPTTALPQPITSAKGR